MKKKTTDPLDERERRALLELAAAIKRTRLALGMSQKKLGDQMGGVRQTTIFRWETGRSKPHPTHLIYFVLNCRPEDQALFENAAGKTKSQAQMDQRRRSVDPEISKSSSEKDKLALLMERIDSIYHELKSDSPESRKWLLGLARMLEGWKSQH